jgi:hypothetical protein
LLRNMADHSTSTSRKTRIVTLALVAWVIFVNLAYYWHLARAYGPQLMERVQGLLPW